MDKLMNNTWFMRIIALLIALMIYLSVNPDSSRNANQVSENQPQSSQIFPKPPGTKKTDQPAPNESSATIENVELKAETGNENYVVSGLPDTVSVDISGPSSQVTIAKQRRNVEVYADLTGFEPGEHEVELKYRNLDSSLKVGIDPGSVKVKIDEKTTKEFPVEASFINEEQIAEGYKPGDPVLNPKTVKVTASKEVIKQISYVRARVNLQGADQDLKQQAQVIVYDKAGNILPVQASPGTIEVTVPIQSPSKTLPVKLNQTGEPPEGVTIRSISISPSEVTAYGPQNILEGLKEITGPDLDLSKIKDDSVVELGLPLPEGVKELSEQKVQVKIDVDKEGEKVLKGIPIETAGLDEGKSIEYLDPSAQAFDITVTGLEEQLKKISSKDFQLLVNASGLEDGEQTIKVEVKGPNDVKWSLPQEEATIRISGTQS
ncbi:YbbR-like domain-containing protein [Metabacillus sp. KIGAM252]|uniref:YbbR-like domain-containing protein n=1 Tax=Metabacillus flavus TaxID=2823519 RepID=A0ABS5L9I3_9BACI|nr:CdaR family protein [Metabacillus flavus]MBS2967380.1 YbbR-like domain-containing protein [Metabacillus flavus]